MLYEPLFDASVKKLHIVQEFFYGYGAFRECHRTDRLGDLYICTANNDGNDAAKVELGGPDGGRKRGPRLVSVITIHTQ